MLQLQLAKSVLGALARQDQLLALLCGYFWSMQILMNVLYQ